DVIEDVIIGCAMPEGEQGYNVARYISVLAGLPNHVPAVTVNRFCSSGLQTIAMAADRVLAGGAEIVVAGGVESMTAVPMTGWKPSPHPGLLNCYPEAYMPRGLTAEEVATRFEVSREAQDAFALKSQEKAAAALEKNVFQDEIVPVPMPDGTLFERDELPRPQTTAEGLAKLRPAFKQGGSVTAGNASPLSDGASAVVVMSREKADELGIKPLVVYRGFQVAGVDPEIMGIGPIDAVPKLLEKAGITVDDIDLVELNEAFASQSVAVIEKLGIDPEKVNVNGGAIALGHPLGATGAKLTTQIIHEMGRRGSRYGVVTMCIGGGMGAAGLFERVT
ncbi:MAG: thiolase family protein, partial [Myxococcota bacterium]|nr:thiolase family protein [Myxococcota bacterium]